MEENWKWTNLGAVGGIFFEFFLQSSGGSLGIDYREKKRWRKQTEPVGGTRTEKVRDVWVRRTFPAFSRVGIPAQHKMGNSRGMGGEPSTPVVDNAGCQVRFVSNWTISLPTGPAPFTKGNSLTGSSFNVSAHTNDERYKKISFPVHLICSARSAGISVKNSGTRTSPVSTFSTLCRWEKSRDRMWDLFNNMRAIRNEDGTIPLAFPEWTPYKLKKWANFYHKTSFRILTWRSPATRPRRLVVVLPVKTDATKSSENQNRS